MISKEANEIMTDSTTPKELDVGKCGVDLLALSGNNNTFGCVNMQDKEMVKMGIYSALWIQVSRII